MIAGLSGEARANDPFWVADRHPHTFHVRLAELGERLRAAPLEGRDARSGVEITLPLPDGRIKRFRVVASPILSPDLARTLVDVHTYRAVGIGDARLTARLDLTRLGVRAMITTPQGTVFVEPAERGRTDMVVSTWGGERSGFECDMRPGPLRPAESTAPLAFGDELHTYRVIFTGTGEYTQSLGGVSLALAEMVTSLNRVNEIFERDLGIRLEAAALLPFADPNTDPYPPGPLDLDRNQVVVDSLFNPQSYDVAQVLNQGGSPGPPIAISGVSYAPCVCSEVKAGSTVSASVATANNSMVKVMAHELGHCFGAFHTGGCNLLGAGSCEPGTGSTIMGRAGRCPAGQNVVESPGDLYFHIVSIGEVLQTRAGMPECGTVLATGNTAPTADAGADFTIPRGTPFVLAGAGSDPDFSDPVSFCWEGTDVAATNGDTVTGPLFRSRPPSASTARYMPAFATVLADTLDPWERLPLGDRTLHFRLTVRDNHPGAGGLAWDDKTITVTGDPFAVTIPGPGDAIPSGPFAVTWSVGGGAVASHVNIALSTDDGSSWTSLAMNTPNDGSENVNWFTGVTLPLCRIRVEAVGNIFYDVSSSFSILAGATGADPVLPGANALALNGPNPARRGVSLSVDLPRAAAVRLGVYAVSGRLVRLLASERWPAGRRDVRWDGKTDSGRWTGSGTYIVRLEVEGRAMEKQIVLLR